MRTVGCRRLIYNLCLEQRSTWGRSHRLSAHDQINELPALKDAYPFLKEVPSHCLQQAVRDVQDAYTRFFKGQNRYPTYAKRSSGDSFRFPDAKQFKVGPSSIELPKFGHVEWAMHRRMVGSICDLYSPQECANYLKAAGYGAV